MEDLARHLVYEEDVKKVVATSIRNASTSSRDTKKVDEGKVKALQERCEGRIIASWRIARLNKFVEFFNTFLNLFIF